MDCIFCKIVRGEIPSAKVYEDENVLAFRDITPAAPVHVLVVPKAHYESLNALEDAPEGLIAALMRATAKVAKLEGVAESGYRVVTNIGRDGRQAVPHLHFHVLGGRQLDGSAG